MTFHLWLTCGDSFKYIPEFINVHNPVIEQKTKTVKSFDACCAFGEIYLSDYKWNALNLVKINTLSISNYVSGLEVLSLNQLNKTEKKVGLEADDVGEIISRYSEDWMLIDTITKKTTIR